MRTTYEDFRTNLINEITRLMPEASPEFCEIQKINGTVVEGLQMNMKNSNTAPVFYPHSLYEDDPADCRMIAAYIVEKTREAFPYGEDLIKDITSFDAIKDRIIIKLVNTAKNDMLLADAPHTHVLDLAATYAVDLGSNDGGDSALVQVRNALFGLWNVDVKTLHATALKNTKERLGLNFRSMRDTLTAFGMADDSIPDFPMNMWILSNRDNLYGASAILLPEAEQMISTACGKRCYAIPSSVHEWIMIPLIKNASEIDTMIKEVNESTVKPEEFLGDHVYLYDEGKLCMV